MMQMNAADCRRPAAKHREQIELMEQSLLADRFKLKVHFETREMPEYALVVAKGGSKLTDGWHTEQQTISVQGGAQGSTMTAKAATIGQLVSMALMSPNAGTGGRAVVDQTGLTGMYDFALKWGPEQVAGLNGDGPASVDGDSAATGAEAGGDEGAGGGAGDR